MVDSKYAPELVAQSLREISIIPLTEPHHLTCAVSNGHNVSKLSKESLELSF